jgi:hypothetical protein
MALYKEIQVYPMIEDQDGSARLINSTDVQGEKPDYYDVSVLVRDEDTHEMIEDHPDYEEHENLTREDAALLLHRLEMKHPDAGVEWLEDGRPDYPDDQGWLPAPTRTVPYDANLPAATFEGLARRLPPLQFEQQKDRWDQRMMEFVYEAEFMHHTFAIELLQPEGKWALFIDHPEAKGQKSGINGRPKPLVDEQDHPTFQAAIDAAEFHRTRLLAEAMGIENRPAQEVVADAAKAKDAVLNDGHINVLEHDLGRLKKSLEAYAETGALVTDGNLDQRLKEQMARAAREVAEAEALVSAYGWALDAEELAEKQRQATAENTISSASPAP